MLSCVVGTSQGVVRWDPTSGPSNWLAFRSGPNLLHDVFAVDFHPSQPEVFQFGGRPGALFTVDSRTRPTDWWHLRLPSTITRLQCLSGGNQVVVAGLRNKLGVYDLRFAGWHRGPVIQFERYCNAAHIDIGFAYDAATGVVAAAHDAPGIVALYSVRTGSQLRLPIVKSMQFQTFPGDHTPTLFVAGDTRSGITAFSFGVDELEDEV
ncbi:hypothetical protein ONZ43_g1541 [Nemania bipapillata]|uniref:Uncharacterized protein n=1 Tax=Nemania bipapillata TaxID=110536 RepID=A0ACC2J426_9PEZI|nr:hypothetical protein ONZ43_g1541 [Nemania bipapillata]